MTFPKFETNILKRNVDFRGFRWVAWFSATLLQRSFSFSHELIMAVAPHVEYRNQLGAITREAPIAKRFKKVSNYETTVRVRHCEHEDDGYGSRFRAKLICHRIPDEISLFFFDAECRYHLTRLHSALANHT